MADAYEIFEDEEAGAWTYKDYLEWEAGNTRYELLDGHSYMMASPSTEHQRISMEISGQFWQFLRGKPCEVFTAPFDVRLFPEEDLSDGDVVQPDIVVVCDKTKLKKNSCAGAPELVIEILSPGNSNDIMFLKYLKYQKSGVKEYWIVDVKNKIIQVNLFTAGGAFANVYSEDDTVPVTLFPGFAIELKSLFAPID